MWSRRGRRARGSAVGGDGAETRERLDDGVRDLTFAVEEEGGASLEDTEALNGADGGVGGRTEGRGGSEGGVELDARELFLVHEGDGAVHQPELGSSSTDDKFAGGDGHAAAARSRLTEEDPFGQERLGADGSPHQDRIRHQ